MLALTLLKILLKNFFFRYVSLYTHQLITMHGVHFATLKLSSKITLLVPKNPFLTILFFCKIGILYPLPIKIGTSSIGLNKKFC